MLSLKLIIHKAPYLLILLLLTTVSDKVFAQKLDSKLENREVIFEANEIQVNQQEGTIIAEGDVLFDQGQYKLTADKVIYNQLADIGNAYGNVVVTTLDGVISKADELQLDESFSHIVASPLLTELADGSRFTALSGERKEGIKAIYRNGKFSPCICDYEAGENPIWDLRSSQIHHDYKTNTIRHENVRMHVLGLPIVFMPWIAHPDPTVNRRSGVLMPTFKFSEDLGTVLRTPIFVVIDETSDVEVIPNMTANRGNVLETKYRKLWSKTDLDASVYTGNVSTFEKEREFVAATNVKLNSSIQNDWNVNLNFNKSSQDTFLRRYDLNSDTALKSEFTGRKTTNNSFYHVEFSEVQNLTDTSVSKNSPIILPSITYEKTSKGFMKDLELTTKMHANHVTNDLGHDIARWNVQQTAVNSHETSLGILDSEFGYLGSFYQINKRNDGFTKTGEVARGNLFASASWRQYYNYNINQKPLIIEPKTKLTFIGGDDKNNDIPNRDSADFRIDSANMFLTNRFQGFDYVLPGARADIGLSVFTNSELLGSLHGFAGVSRRHTGEVPSGLSTGTDTNLSDYVATISAEKNNFYAFSWSGRINSTSSNLDESRTKLSTKLKNARFMLAHTQLTQNYFTSADNDLEEASVSISQRLKKGVNLRASQNWDLSDSKINRDKSSFVVSWSDGLQDCLTVSLRYDRDPEVDRDIKTKETYQLLLNFKYLGGVPYDSN